MTDHAVSILRQHALGLFTFSENGRMTGVNEFELTPAPRLYLGRSNTECVHFIRADVPELIAEAISTLANKEPLLTEDPRAIPEFHDDYRRLLSVPADDEIRGGPVYRFPLTEVDMPLEVERITAKNAYLLERYLPDWLPDVPHRFPFWAAVVDGHAVAVCASVRMTDAAHEAGVATATRFRRQGHAYRAVQAWANEVKATGANPVYSTDWTNVASQAVARRLGLTFIGTDYQL